MRIIFTVAILLCVAFSFVEANAPVMPFENAEGGNVSAAFSGQIDSFVFGKLKQMAIQPANQCSDAVFIRRVYLDVTGTLPRADEVVKFLEDKNPGKRKVLIDCLLARDEFADYLGMKWCDLLRVKSEFPVNLWPEATQAYDHWIRDSIRRNVPYSLFAWEILTASGSNFRVPQVNFYRSAGSKEPKAIARAVALTFMGERTEHWPKAKLDAMAAFFSKIGFKSTNEWKEEIVFGNGIAGDIQPPATGILPDGTSMQIPCDRDPREIFAQWLIFSKNSPFARNAVNRTWYLLFGRGIIEEPDDSRPDNPPSNPELLAWLARELVSSNYDIKHIYRLILNSGAYQLSCISAMRSPAAEANFAFHSMRPLDAEVLIDALDQITGATEEYSSMVPEPYTFLPGDRRSILLPDGSIGSAFLDLFGRPPRDTGLLSERRSHLTAAQRLHLLNSSHVQSKLTKSEPLKKIIRANNPSADIVKQLYLTILSRYPTEDELKAINTYSQSAEAKGPTAMLDVAWSLINSAEFLYQH